MSMIPKQFKDSVVAFGKPMADGSGVAAWIGTGFIVSMKEPDDNAKSTCYLITNRHVVADDRKLKVRFNVVGGAGVQNLDVTLRDEKNQFFTAHPNEKVDVVAIQILPKVLENMRSAWGMIDIDAQAADTRQMQAQGIDEGQLVYSLGYPLGEVQRSFSAPICRGGCIARIADLFANSGELSFLIDAQIFPGNSGSPVINRPDTTAIQGMNFCNKAMLIGIVAARRLIKSEHRAQDGSTIVNDQGIGLAEVFPVEYIRQTVRLEWKRCRGVLYQ